MAHFIEVIRNSKAETLSFLDGLFYSDSVSAIGYRISCGKTRAVAVNWDAEEISELDEKISEMITDVLQTGDGLDEITAYCQIFPETVHYNSECQDY